MSSSRKLDRRHFLGAASATAGVARLRTGRTGAAPSQADPLGVREDFPVTTEGIYLDSAYIIWLGAMLMQAGKEAEALADIKRAVAMNPRWLELLERIQEEHLPGAREILQKVQ